MYVSLMILLAGLPCSLALGQIPNTPRTVRQRAVVPQSRRQIRLLLREQIKKWHSQAYISPPILAEQILKEKPDVVNLEVMVGNHWQEVTKLLLMEIRRPGDPWEKTFATRGLLALLDLAGTDQLSLLDRQLAQAYLAGPQYIRALPKPQFSFPPTEQENSAQTKQALLSEGYLRALRQAKEDAESRNAQDERIMYSNQLVSVCEQDFTALLVGIRSPQAYQAIIRKLSQQLNTKDAAFAQTVQALQDNPPVNLNRNLAKSTLARLQGLAKRFAGLRSYTVHTEVHKQQRKQSSFGKTELDFNQIIQPTLEQLFQQSQGNYRVDRVEPLEKIAEPTAEPAPANNQQYKEVIQ